MRTQVAGLMAGAGEVTMLDLFYIAIVIAFFALLWGFTRASERL